HRDRGRLRAQGGGHVENARQLFVGGRQDTEGEFVALAEDRLGGAVCRHHGNSVRLRDDRVGGGGGAAVRAEDELRLLVRDQLLDQGCREVGIALVVLVLDLDRVLDAVDDDPASLVDPVEPEIIALLCQASFLGLRSGQRDRGPKDNCRPGRGCARTGATARRGQEGREGQKDTELLPPHRYH